MTTASETSTATSTRRAAPLFAVARLAIVVVVVIFIATIVVGAAVFALTGFECFGPDLGEQRSRGSASAREDALGLRHAQQRALVAHGRRGDRHRRVQCLGPGIRRLR